MKAPPLLGGWNRLEEESGRRPATRPSGRGFASSFSDMEGRFYVFGGATPTGSSNELWSILDHLARRTSDGRAPPA